MREYDVIAIGTGSVMSIVTQILTDNPDFDIAVIEKDAPGGICLTRGCIPSKMILYPAEVVNHIKNAEKFGIDAEINNIDFNQIMERMRNHVNEESNRIGKSLSRSEDLDFYHKEAEFIDDYTLIVGNQKIKGNKILICSGSEPLIPPIENLEDTGYITSKDLLKLEKLPKSIVIIGGGYIAAEYGFFLSMMGTNVAIIGRNKQFVPSEEPEISDVLKKKFSEHVKIYTGHEVVKTKRVEDKKQIIAQDKENNTKKMKADEILVATGRKSNSDYLKPERTGVKTDKNGWIKVNNKLETSKNNIWAMGDAIGKHMFKHVANYEAEVVYHNAFGEGNEKVDYHAVPHAIFTYPEVASVGMTEEEAKKEHDVLIGYQSYTDTAKGSAMKADDYFVKVLVDKENYKILGTHIVGPQASTLIHEVINLMYTNDQSVTPIYRGMHIHPSLNEVVERAFFNLHSHSHEH